MTNKFDPSSELSRGNTGKGMVSKKRNFKQQSDDEGNIQEEEEEKSEAERDGEHK